ncbi:hypothetical protein [Solibacillus sp. FSL H8-0538]|uniref:hypothetical protein n=1 Tax=Solibacillus sp. FSL H8-0538 TaxID=2921400 RepID=UPI0030F4C4CF
MYPYSNTYYSYPLNAAYQPSSYSQYTAPIRHLLKQHPYYNDCRCISKAEVELKSMNRLLWLEHVNWTRMTISSIVFNLPDLPFVQERLLQNATDLGNFLRPFYGDQLADRFAVLIKEHLVIAAELVTAAVKGDTQTADAKEKEWYRNADDIAAFLSSINPYLGKEELQKMFYTHLALTKSEAVSMIQKNYKLSIDIFDQIEAQALEMADMISSAIIMQFHCLF